MTTAERMLYLRGKRKWTQSYAAQQSHICQSNYSKYESGHLQPNANTIQKIADAFQIHPCALTGFSVYQPDSRKRSHLLFLLMLLHRSHIFLLDGERDETQHLKPDSLRFSVHIPKSALTDLIHWEYLYSQSDWKQNEFSRQKLEQLEIELLSKL